MEDGTDVERCTGLIPLVRFVLTFFILPSINSRREKSHPLLALPYTALADALSAPLEMPPHVRAGREERRRVDEYAAANAMPPLQRSRDTLYSPPSPSFRTLSTDFH